MTTITKLGIMGIRSFDHERMEILDFERPVTLIVGPNGSGKTTIIECLKMASSGILPPNSTKGHGFIHDPQVAHLPEVKAQIKMTFTTAATKKELLVVRSFQLTNKKVGGKTKTTYKALDSCVRTQGEDGSKASLSYRCADIDLQVTELMGVSKAILDSVIFCHQEDASWPLLDAASVKKRFDDIFGATRYTQALKNIRDLQREWTKVQRERRSDADLSQAHMDTANKIRAQKDDKDKAVEELTTELKCFDDQVTQANESTQKAEVEMVQYESCGVRVAELRSLLGRCEQDRQQEQRQMEEKQQDFFKEPLEVLLQQIKTFKEKTLVESEQRVRRAKGDLVNGESNYQAAVSSARKVREDVGETVAAVDLLASRKAELSDRLEKSGQASVAVLRTQLEASASECARIERDQRQRDAASQQSLEAAERALREAELETSKNESRSQDASEAIRRLEPDAKALSRAQPELDALVKAMRENEAALGAEGSDARLRRLDARQEEIGRRRHDLNYSISRKSSEVAQLEAQSDAHVEVDSLRKRFREAENELGAKLGEVRPKLVALLGQMPEATDAEARVAGESQQLEDNVRRHRQAMQERYNKRSAIAGRRATTENDLGRLIAEEQKLAHHLGASPMHTLVVSGAASLGMGDFNTRLAQQREVVELARKDLAMTESAQHMYEKFREKSRTKNTCQFCRRCFDTEVERNTFEDSVKRLVDKIPTFLEESKRRLDASNNEHMKLDSQRPSWSCLENLRVKEIPHRQKEIQAAIDEEQACQAEVAPLEAEQRKLEERAQQLQALRAEAATVTRMGRAVDELRAGVRAKEARLLGANSKVSLQAERDQLRTLQEQLCELGREEDAVRTQRDLLAKQQEQLRTQLAEQKGRLQLLQAQVARQGDVTSELVNRQAIAKDCSEAARKARAAAEVAGAQVKGLRVERQEVATRFRRDIEARDVEVRGLQREVDALTELEKSIEVMRGRVENADALKAQLAAADNAARAAERELEGLRAKLESEEDKFKKREAMQATLQANLKLKSVEQEIKRNETEVEELMKDLGGRDLDALRRDVEACRKRSVDLQSQRAFREGALTQTRQSVSGLEVELASPLYAGIEGRHREAIIKFESAAFAAKDLTRYHGALDKALMRFHTTKMAEINRSIRELWNKVYRGRDIDYIALRSDSEEQPAGAAGQPAVEESTAGRALRSYNYRVVMVCGDAEMEMRGRCSAGQRVLASIIIRLALADSFCVHCGILALDEPTTNLDAANIRGLAEAIADLIEQRKNNNRFQLVLITHDEVFVDHLSQLQVADWYWHIKKDDSGCSKIERRDMRLLAA